VVELTDVLDVPVELVELVELETPDVLAALVELVV
jgi:hypothetical protein